MDKISNSYRKLNNYCADGKPPLGQFSYACVNTGYGNNKYCKKQNVPPGPGSYSNMQECLSNCNGKPPLGQFSYACVNTE